MSHSEEAHFRDRAKQCRLLAEQARDEAARLELNTMADELEAEADRIAAEDPDPSMQIPPEPQ